MKKAENFMSSKTSFCVVSFDQKLKAFVLSRNVVEQGRGDLKEIEFFENEIKTDQDLMEAIYTCHSADAVSKELSNSKEVRDKIISGYCLEFYVAGEETIAKFGKNHDALSFYKEKFDTNEILDWVVPAIKGVSAQLENESGKELTK